MIISNQILFSFSVEVIKLKLERRGERERERETECSAHIALHILVTMVGAVPRIVL